jgi:hypothetical protein
MSLLLLLAVLFYGAYFSTSNVSYNRRKYFKIISQLQKA